MLNNSSHNDKVIKIFSGIRCLSKDQLPRYLEGRLTDVEKHLVEQHLADCDLCFEAIQALEKESNTDQYNDLTGKLQRYIQQSILPVSHVQKVAQYTRKERTKENLLVYFWLIAFGVLGVSGVYVLKGHMRNAPTMPRLMVSSVAPVPETKDTTTTAATQVDNGEKPVAAQPIIAANHATPAHQSAPAPAPNPAPATPIPTANTTAIPPTKPAPAPVKVDSVKLKQLALERAAKKKARADSLAKVQAATAEAKKQDSLKKAAAAAEKEEQDREAAEKQANAAKAQAAPPSDPVKKEEPKKDAPALTNSDENLYKAAMQLQQQGSINEAMDRYRRIEANGNGKYVEMARYQLAICYRSKGQMGKARRMFKEVVKMDGSLKTAAQQALDTM
ncbi:putative zinc finger protein [Chitinophaga dinghuensis]|uniref:Putative zinc finger protein n=1 Tax=Chitinophaga dinghuensis TaxID=1539050 RepID=A0A327VYK0_9BACT|nr:zf-HC2 domain-containing protein [Chitinophaga dinghuensis]RAJ82087.1 putative zinc finger protein [Chitinophaga dinghuensis]